MVVSQQLLPSKGLKHALQQRTGWYPRALRWWNLTIAALLCWAIIATLLYFLAKSQRDGGIIFASNINDLPLERSFPYLYLPTIVAVLFSIFIVWIDVDAKRFEPYYQLSKSGGALGKDSLLLHYPFDFMPIVPFLAFKNRHWLVFWSSLATVLTTFAIVPLQAGIFSTDNVTRTFEHTFVLSEKFMHSSVQASQLTLSYAQSAYGILNLNESTPAFMALNYTLAPFAAPGLTTDHNGTWTANTTLYSLNLVCEEAHSGFGVYNNSAGDCSVGMSNFGNYTIGQSLPTKTGGVNPNMRVKSFSGFYSGYFGGHDHYFGTRSGSSGLGYTMQFSCPRSGNRTFFAAFIRNKDRKEDRQNNVTAVFCKPSYYEQMVQATVDAKTKSPISYVGLESIKPLTPALFNGTVFEETLASGQRQLRSRENNLPVDVLPRYLERLYDTDLTPMMVYSNNFDLPPMLAMAMTASKKPLQDLLDPRALIEAYETAYRLLFVRAMTDVLKTDFSSATNLAVGERMLRSQAIILEPVFTYLVVAFLGLVSLSAIALLYIGTIRNKGIRLSDDPGSITSVMSLVADNTDLLTNFQDLDCCAPEYMQEKLQNRRYKFEDGVSLSRITEMSSPPTTQATLLQQADTASVSVEHSALQITKPLGPTEFRLFMAVPLLSLFAVLMIVLAVLYAKNKPHGLPLPSKNHIVQNLVREYLPTVIATLIEPIWILINRILCTLQPLEALQSSRASASRSITLNYTSLPPQLTIVRAVRAGHLLLAVVCSMALLANLLAIAFAGLLFQDVVPLASPTLLSAPFLPRLQEINGSTGPPINGLPAQSTKRFSGAFQGGTGEDQFLISESNYTRNTSLPFWVDENTMYLPYLTPERLDPSSTRRYQARTKYFSARPNCKPLTFGDDYQLRLWNNSTDSNNSTKDQNSEHQTFDVKIGDKHGNNVTCYASETSFSNALGRMSRIAYENICQTGKTAAELATTLDAGRNATQDQIDTCTQAVAIGWMRTTQWNCSDPAKYNTPPPGFEEANARNTFFLSCQPSIVVGDATIVVNSAGLLLEKPEDRVPDADPEALESYFSNGVGNLISHSNLFLFRTLTSPWHNDSFASEHIHYLMNRAEGSLRLTNPSEPLPRFRDVEDVINKAYARLFAIWLGVNMDLLFVRSKEPAPQIPGTAITFEERIFFKTPLFIISEIILGVYILVTAIVYSRRPGRYLTRVPTSIATVIALFAASAAVKDLQGTADYTNKQREKRLEDLGCTYGYGSFVGGDGSVHVGIDKVPYVRSTRSTTVGNSRSDTKSKQKEKKNEVSRAKVQYTRVEGNDRL